MIKVSHPKCSRCRRGLMEKPLDETKIIVDTDGYAYCREDGIHHIPMGLIVEHPLFDQESHV